jgi:hypothetical protein
VAACRQHGLEVEDEGHLKNFVVIFFLLRCFVLFNVSFNTKSFFAKKQFLYNELLAVFRASKFSYL